ncbi:MAG: ribokinase, partial [Gemmataceae bacterium]
RVRVDRVVPAAYTPRGSSTRPLRPVPVPLPRAPTMPPRPPRIVVVGSANTDLVMRVRQLPRPGETVLGGTFAAVPGGKGANQAVAAARAGGQTTFVAKVGADAMGDAAIAAYRDMGIDTAHVTRHATSPSGVALIFVDDSAENCIVIVGGANAEVSVQQVRDAAEVIQSADLVLAQGETPCEATREAFILAHEAGRKTVLNPAPFHEEFLSLMPWTDLLIINEVERHALQRAGAGDPVMAWSPGGGANVAGCPSVVLTMGKKGCCYWGPEGEIRQEAFAVEAVDPTAAGDAFIGALAVEIASGQSLVESLRKASAAAALTVTRWGAQQAFPTRQELDRFLKSAKEARR